MPPSVKPRENEAMPDFRFYNCTELRCPTCGATLEFLQAKERDGMPPLLQHPKTKGCRQSNKLFFAGPTMVILTEYRKR